jgi:hypothetical protein
MGELLEDVLIAREKNPDVVSEAKRPGKCG